ncbi:secreted protein [Bathymodiolus azoricus thioautotrophic gill symbiont]|uniref:Secreted protein n=1 Tax=Bathymodiolus azoricus thioautotrophic gill symbiont TaxID=235205 RepID=A0A1H6K267_9GAMM|nr:secreted protein [Bathymodiolus azoricus thioautotrophic gill symbiont]
MPISIRSPKVLILVIFLAMAVLALPAIFVKVFAATVIATLECSPPRLGVTLMVY